MSIARAGAITVGDFIDHHPQCVLVEVASALGSTPREAGAFMIVAPDDLFGTIGGPIFAVVSGGIGTILVVFWVARKWPEITQLGKLSD